MGVGRFQNRLVKTSKMRLEANDGHLNLDMERRSWPDHISILLDAFAFRRSRMAILVLAHEAPEPAAVQLSKVDC